MDVKRLARILENKNDLIVNEVILNKAQKEGQVIYGAKAFNYQSPTYLKKKTFDYDILTKKPRKSAIELAKELARRTGEKTEIIKGRHKGTYRVKLGEDIIADYTQLKRKPKTKRFLGTNIKDLKSIKKDARRLIKKESTEYRRNKDLDTLDRIKEIERIENLF